MKPGRSYHHGDLKRAALDAALEIVDEAGADALSMREVAKRAGATHGAIYQHFSDKRTLFSMVAAEGYGDLAKRMRRAASAARGSKLDLVRALARCYIRFAAERPAHFRIMSEPDLTHRLDAYPPLQDAHDAVVAQLHAAVADAQDACEIRAGDTREIALTIWVFTHGYAESMRTRRGFYYGPSGPPASRRSIEAHFLRVLEPLLGGLAPRSPDRR